MRHVANRSSLDVFEKFVRTFVKNLGLIYRFSTFAKINIFNSAACCKLIIFHKLVIHFLCSVIHLDYLFKTPCRQKQRSMFTFRNIQEN